MRPSGTSRVRHGEMKPMFSPRNIKVCFQEATLTRTYDFKVWNRTRICEKCQRLGVLWIFQLLKQLLGTTAKMARNRLLARVGLHTCTLILKWNKFEEDTLHLTLGSNETKHAKWKGLCTAQGWWFGGKADQVVEVFVKGDLGEEKKKKDPEKTKQQKNKQNMAFGRDHGVSTGQGEALERFFFFYRVRNIPASNGPAFWTSGPKSMRDNHLETKLCNVKQTSGLYKPLASMWRRFSSFWAQFLSARIWSNWARGDSFPRLSALSVKLDHSTSWRRGKLFLWYPPRSTTAGAPWLRRWLFGTEEERKEKKLRKGEEE